MFPAVHSAGSPTRFGIVAATASAGGFEALATILNRLPPSFPIPIVIAQHLPGGCHSSLIDRLQQRTPLRVRWAKDGDHLSGGDVFIGPPGCHILVWGQELKIVSVYERHRIGPCGDLLLSSAAVAFGSRAIGLILTGYSQDGARGAQFIKRFGGVIIVQDPSSADVPSMPLAALDAGPTDFTLPLGIVSSALISFVMQPGAAELFCADVGNGG